ncbi:MAG: hypothetical protein J6S85_13790 [Methanobrevibacter sp.]|nr:hypothetical protein [Methanobrevibacter sp.]
MTTMYTFLMYKDPETVSADWEKLVDVKSYPDLIGTPETLDSTSLSDSERHFEVGLKGSDAWEFTANYSKVAFTKVNALAGQLIDISVWFGGTKAASASEATPTGTDGKFTTKGYVSVTPAGGEVNAISDMTITITKNADVAFE